jgi:hypothetical protein
VLINQLFSTLHSLIIIRFQYIAPAYFLREDIIEVNSNAEKSIDKFGSKLVPYESYFKVIVAYGTETGTALRFAARLKSQLFLCFPLFQIQFKQLDELEVPRLFMIY